MNCKKIKSKIFTHYTLEKNFFCINILVSEDGAKSDRIYVDVDGYSDE